MDSLKRTGVLAVLSAAMISLSAVPKYAQNFPPGPADDLTTSLGSYKVWVYPKWRSAIDGCPGYNNATGMWESGTLFGPATVVGRSAPHLDASSRDDLGTPVGSAATVISDAHFAILPPGFEGPAGTNEVHTEIFSMNVTGGGAAVRAGPGAGVLPISTGEVESKTLAGNDFPAESFFDVYVEVDLPGCSGFTGGTVYNPLPLLVADTSLASFPPRVIYTHRNSSAILMLFKNDDPAGQWKAGERFGLLVLAGQGVSYTNSPDDLAEFEEFMLTVPEMPIIIPAVTPYGMIALALILAAGAGVWIWRRRRPSAA